MSYVGSKPPRAWLGTAAEALAQKAHSANVPVDLFRGHGPRGRAALPAKMRMSPPPWRSPAWALKRPACAWSRTRDCRSITMRVQAEGSFGHFEITVRGNPHSAQPKTSALVAFSLARYLTRRQAILSFA